MEPIGLAVGVAGLAGLFSSVIDAVDRVNDYQSFNADLKTLDAQLEGHRAKLESWGQEVGLEKGQLSTDHEANLDPQAFYAAEQLLEVANEVLALGPGETSRGRKEGPGKSNDGWASVKPHALSNSRRSKIAWALGRKAEQTNKVETFGKIVQQLSDLVPRPANDAMQPLNRRDTGFAGPQGVTVVSHPGVSEFIAETRKMNAQLEAERKAQMKRELTAWLLGQTTTMNERYHDSVQKRLPGTCEWIFHQPQFLQWIEKDTSEDKRSLLWIHGHAGFGKTVLCAQITQRLVSDNDRPVAYFFFSSDFASRDDPYIAFRCWVSQLVSSNSTAFELALDKWNDSTDQTIASRQNVAQLLQQILLEVPWCTLIIDGLDECTAAHTEQQGNLELFLNGMREAMADTTRVLLVSRDEPKIRQALCDNQENLSLFKLSTDHVRGDIAMLSQHLVNTRLPNKNETMKNELSERLTSRCDGQFIWLMMQEPSLRKGKKFKDLKRAIEQTPTRLNQLYERNWNFIMGWEDEKDRHRAFAILRWAAFSSRPLTVCEMAEAVLLDESIDEFPVDDLPDSIDEDYIDSEILGLCGPLIEVRHQSNEEVPQSQTVHLAHFTVRQFLIHQLPHPYGNIQLNESLRSSNERIHTLYLSRLCLAYIQWPNSWDDTEPTEESGFKKFLRDYASSSWHSYLASCTEDESNSEINSEVLQLILKFMAETHPCWNLWKQWFDKQDQDEEAIAEAEEVTGVSEPLYYALRLGLGEVAVRLSQQKPPGDDKTSGRSVICLACRQGNGKVVSSLLESAAGTKIETRGLRNRTPLYTAAMYGHTSLVEMLHQMGGNHSATNAYGWTPVNVATDQGHTDTVRFLLDNGVDPNEAEDEGFTPLHMSAFKGNFEVVRMLLDKGAKVAPINKVDWTPLDYAASNGHLDITRLLLDKGAELCPVNDDNWTPLHHAASKGHLEIVRLLLERGASTCVANISGFTALGSAALDGHVEIVRLLLGAGASLSIPDKNGRTPLACAASNGHLETVQILLERGADANAADKSSNTPLRIAAACGYDGIIRLLLEKDAKVNVVDDNDWTPLKASVVEGYLETTRLLLDEGAELSGRDRKGWAALHHATDRGHLPIVRLLLDRGAITSTTDGDGCTPLHSAAVNGHLETVSLLLEKGADVETPSHNGWTPLNSAILKGHIQSVSLLIEKGADIHKCDAEGWTAVNTASNKGFYDIVSLLLAKGADPSIPNNANTTPLSSAAINSHADVARLLVENGVDVSVADNHGWTALNTAASYGSCEIVSLLLEKGASLEANNSGCTPLISASHFGFAEVVHLLLEHASHFSRTDWKKEQLHRQDKTSRTALFYSARTGNAEIVRALLSTGDIQPMLADHWGSTALHAAVINGHSDVVELLLEYDGSWISLRDGLDRPITWWSQRSRSIQVSEILFKYARKHDTSLDMFDLFPKSIGDSFTSNLFWCDKCTRNVPDNSEYYECQQCTGWKSFICEQCAEAGVECINRSHTMELRQPTADSS